MKINVIVGAWLLAAGLISSCGGNNTNSNVLTPGAEKDAKSKLLETGANLLQEKLPLKKLMLTCMGFIFKMAT